MNDIQNIADMMDDDDDEFGDQNCTAYGMIEAAFEKDNDIDTVKIYKVGLKRAYDAVMDIHKLSTCTDERIIANWSLGFPKSSHFSISEIVTAVLAKSIGVVYHEIYGEDRRGFEVSVNDVANAVNSEEDEFDHDDEEIDYTTPQPYHRFHKNVKYIPVSEEDLHLLTPNVRKHLADDKYEIVNKND